MQAFPLIAAVAALVVAGGAAWADHRAVKRRDLTRAGWIPWPQVMLFALLMALILAVAGFAP